MNLHNSTQFFANDNYDYFREWTLDFPFVVQHKAYKELIYIQKIMEKLIRDFASNYKEYAYLMPVDKRVSEILDIASKIPYSPGTYRTDFVLDKENQFKLIEITCRFALNGIFQTSIFSEFNQRFVRKHSIKSSQVNDYKNVFTHLEARIGNKNKVIILTGGDIKNESKIYVDIFKRIGLDIIKIDYQDIDENVSFFDNALIISELAHSEIKSLSNNVIRRLTQNGMLNDLRTIFLIHDKRFFEVINNPTLQRKNLSDDEIELFRRYTIPSHSYHSTCRYWKDAKKNKDKWIIKHRALGKSQDISAGNLLNEQDWNAIFEREDLSDLVLQEWVEQKTFKNYYQQQLVHEYIVGTLLFFDSHFFGLGEFRTSSYPITNKVDHRKAAPIVFHDDIPTLLQDYQI
ncbi:hypothetical protein [Marinomonas sp. GJ51-6]|uniref:hypothetical protein n=1 Tax=Marinomonas sp. GJ51-6 TaxID=2992802 RepID=UPI002934A1CD|nr:hypothetical protein [Marinomonas sp. GJ51-6]WOD06185.1 hypothetical protein ONZ50_10585 [Marinomonas sp. GJ51-6]